MAVAPGGGGRVLLWRLPWGCHSRQRRCQGHAAAVVAPRGPECPLEPVAVVLSRDHGNGEGQWLFKLSWELEMKLCVSAAPLHLLAMLYS